MHFRPWIGCVALASASVSHGAELPDIRALVTTVNGEYLSFSGDYGSRRVVDGQTRIDVGENKLVLGIAQGMRKADGHRAHSVKLSGAFVRDWTPSLSTRTAVSISRSTPVFVNREIAQDVSLRVLGGTVLTVGGRHARYFGDVEALSLSAGATQYFKGGLLSYRFSSFDLGRFGKGVGHLASVKLRDHYGSSQVWFGRGSAMHDADWLVRPGRGRHTSVELGRSHRLVEGVDLSIALRRSFFKTETAKFSGAGARVGITLRK